MASVIRFDAVVMSPPVRMANGWLRVDGRTTRIGIFKYYNADGSVRRELRLPEEVFSPKSMQSFGMVPVTNDHPGEKLDATNTKTHAVGMTGELVRRDGDWMVNSMVITDEQAVADVLAGKTALSNGYECVLDETPGTYQGERYDAIQRGICGNHVAIVDAARAGPDAKIRMDGEYIETTKEKKTMKKIKINGVEFEVSESCAQAFDKYDADQRADADKMKAKFDDASEKLKTAETARKDAEDPVAMTARINKRVSLVSTAKEYLGDVKLDAKTDREIKVDVIAKKYPKLVTKDASDAYVDARYDAITEDPAPVEKKVATIVTDNKEDAPVDEEAARKAMIANHEKRHIRA